MRVKVPSDTEEPLDLDTEEDLERITESITALVDQGRLDFLLLIRDQLWGWLEQVGHYDYLLPGEWTCYVAACDAIHQLVSQEVSVITSTDGDDSRLKKLFPHLRSYGKTDWKSLFDVEINDEDRLFRDFFPSSFDAESDNSDEEEGEFRTRGTRTAIAQQRRKPSKKQRRPTSRVDHLLAPDSQQLKARMDDKMGPGFGRAFGQDLSKLVLPQKGAQKGRKGGKTTAPVSKTEPPKKDDVPSEDEPSTPPESKPPVVGLDEKLEQARKHQGVLDERNTALLELQSWLLRKYREERAHRRWKSAVPSSMDELRTAMREHLGGSTEEGQKGGQDEPPDRSEELEELTQLEKVCQQRETKAAAYIQPINDIFSTVRGKFSYGRAEMVKGNAEIYYPPGTLTEEVLAELRGVNEDLAAGKAVRENRFAIAQYRGISYDIDKFNVTARRRSRESVELILPVYAGAVFDCVKIKPGDYYAGVYSGDKRVSEQLAFEAERLKKELVRKRKSGAIELSAGMREVFRSWTPSAPKSGEQDSSAPKKQEPKEVYKGKLRKSESGPLRYSSVAYALQNFYTINYGGFFGLLRHFHARTARAHAGKGESSGPPRPEAMTEEDERVCSKIFGGLSSAGNPFASSGKTPRHALRYAYGIKFYTTADGKQKLRPDWTPLGRPTHPYAGKVYVSLHPVSDFAGEDAPLDVVALQAKGEVDVPDDILLERESAFPAVIPKDRIAIEHIARYPSLNGDYKGAYLQKYGLTKEEWEAYRSLAGIAVNDNQRSKVMEAMSEWMVRFHEARLVELARRVAEAQEKILVYRGDDGLLVPGVEVDQKVANAIRSSSTGGSDLTTLGGPSKRDLLERGLLQGGLEEPQEPVRVVGIMNSGNDCYLSSVLQLLAVLDPAARYEREDGDRDDAALAGALLAFRDTLLADAAEGTYLGKWPWVFTNQESDSLRNEIAGQRNWEDLYGQQDACEALETLLGAFDRSREENFTSQELGEMPGQEWAGARASKFHVRRRIVRTYDTEAGGQELAIDDPIELEPNSTRTTFDTIHIVQLFFPRAARVDVDEGGEKETSLEALLAHYLDFHFDPENTGTIRAKKGPLYFPEAKLLREQIEWVDAPAELLIQIKRFADVAAKVTTPVIVPEQLVNLRLHAAVLHHGRTLSRGHYTACVKVGDDWFHINDDLVTELPAYPEELLKDGYLFYYR